MSSSSVFPPPDLAVKKRGLSCSLDYIQSLFFLCVPCEDLKEFLASQPHNLKDEANKLDWSFSINKEKHLFCQFHFISHPHIASSSWFCCFLMAPHMMDRPKNMAHFNNGDCLRSLFLQIQRKICTLPECCLHLVVT